VPRRFPIRARTGRGGLDGGLDIGLDIGHVGGGKVRQGEQRLFAFGLQVGHLGFEGVKFAGDLAACLHQVGRAEGVGIQIGPGRQAGLASGDFVADLPAADAESLADLGPRGPAAVEFRHGINRFGPDAAACERRLDARGLGAD